MKDGFDCSSSTQEASKGHKNRQMKAFHTLLDEMGVFEIHDPQKYYQKPIFDGYTG